MFKASSFMPFKRKPVPLIELTILMKTIVKGGNEHRVFITTLFLHVSENFHKVFKIKLKTPTLSLGIKYNSQ